MNQPASATIQATLQERFDRLAETWRRETSHLSSTMQMARHPAYREIVALGTAAVPLLLRAIVSRPSHWHMALREITGANPVPREDWGKMDRVDQAWLQWGRENGYQC